MIKKIVYFFCSVIILFATSCSNILNSSNKADIAIVLGTEFAEEISKSVSSAVTPDSELVIRCSFKGLKIKPQSTVVKITELESATIQLENIPLNKQFQILVDVLFNDNVIFTGQSKTVLLDSETSNLNKVISLEPRKSKIVYEAYGGIFPGDENAIEEYFIIDNVTPDLLPHVRKKGYDFEGWYIDKELTKPFDNLGQSNFMGDVTLYAKWKKLPPDVVFSQTAEVTPTGINIKWINPDVDDLAKIVITCVETNEAVEVTESSKTKANETVSHLITLGDKSKSEYTFKIHAVDSTGLVSGDVITSAIKLPIINQINNIKTKGPSHSNMGIPFDVVVKGANFTANGVTASSFAVDTPNINGDSPSVTVKSDTELTLHLFTPETADISSQRFTINYNGEEKSGNFSVREYEMGDIVLADGSVLSGSSAADPTDQAKAVAVIFRAKSGDQPALGVGLKEAQKLFANTDTILHRLNVPSTICIPDKDEVGSAINTEFSSTGKNDMVGSDNFDQIVAEFKKRPDYENKTDEEIKSAILQQSPALDYVDKYKDAMNIPNNGYETGWFIPSIAELCEIAKAKTNNLNTNIANAGGSQLKDAGYDDIYWSSSQYEDNQCSNRALRFKDNWINGDGLKDSNEYFVRPIRVF